MFRKLMSDSQGSAKRLFNVGKAQTFKLLKTYLFLEYFANIQGKPLNSSSRFKITGIAICQN
jgi:hypothetical protein